MGLLVPVHLEPCVLPLLASLASVSEQIRALDRRVDRLMREEYPETMLLPQVSGGGNLTALAFMVTLGKGRDSRS